MVVEYAPDVGYKGNVYKEGNLIPKTNLKKKEDYEKDPNCKNCPYFIYRIPCPYHRGEVSRLRNPMSQNPSKRARRK